MQENLETFLVEARERSSYGDGYPPIVEKTFRAYVECGIWAHGFLRVRCEDCGHETQVAFSCKKRGVCPSCTARRMSETAAHLVDSVLPKAPYRQWVLSLPYQLRWMLYRDEKRLTQVHRIVMQCVFAYQRKMAKRLGTREVHPGAITFVQRFGTALNVNVHFHALVPDGVFVQSDNGLVFIELAPPTDEDIARIVQRIAKRVNVLLEHPEEEDQGNDAIDSALGESVAQTLSVMPSENKQRALWEHPHIRNQRSAVCDGFSLHAHVKIEAYDRKGLERLCRYGLRSPFSVERISRTDDGRVRYKLKKPFPHQHGITELLLEPRVFLRRLALLIPKPRVHLTRYSGIFAPHAQRRNMLAALVPQTADLRAALPPMEKKTDVQENRIDPADHANDNATQHHEQPRQPRHKRYSWSKLLARVFQIDVTVCPECSGKMKIIAAITERDVIVKVLSHIGLPTDAPLVFPARASPDMEFDFA